MTTTTCIKTGLWRRLWVGGAGATIGRWQGRDRLRLRGRAHLGDAGVRGRGRRRHQGDDRTSQLLLRQTQVRHVRGRKHLPGAVRCREAYIDGCG